MKKVRHSIDYVRCILKEKWLSLIGDYVACNITILCQCDRCGHRYEPVLKNIQAGTGCPECARNKRCGQGNWRYCQDRNLLTLRQKYRTKCKNMLRHCLSLMKTSKHDKTYTLLGYTPLQLKKHIESHLNYKNCVGKDWHVDHIFPIKAFLDKNITDVSVINSLDNLQPIIAGDNFSKSSKYDKPSFERWLCDRAGTPCVNNVNCLDGDFLVFN